MPTDKNIDLAHDRFSAQEDRSDLWTPKDIWMNEGIKKEIRWKSVDGGMRVKRWVNE